MVEVVFHVGAHKCATTALQTGLERLAAIRPGLVYAPSTRIGGGGDDRRCPALHDLIRLVGRGPEAPVRREDVVDGLCRWIDRRGAQDRIVFSDEYIIGGMAGVRWSFYPRAGLAREVIEDVARRFPTRMFLQSRETAAYLRSSHRFRVRMGMTLGYDAFLERYDLSSISWARLGQTLFDGAPYAWRVLPSARIPDRAALGSALDFVVPGWDLDEVPFPASNESNRPLMRAATLVLQRFGRTIDTSPAGPVADAFDAVEADLVEGRKPGERDKLIGEALARLGIKAGPKIARMIRLQYDEEREPDGSLQRLLAERFAPDYAAFLAAYAVDGR